MDWEGKVEAPRLVCAASGANIEAGDTFWSALLFSDGLFRRQDYTLAAWEGLPREGLLSWWRQRAPQADEKPRTIDVEALLGMFHALKDSSERPKQCFLFVIVLFLVRARKLRFRDSIRENGHGYLLVEDKVLKCLYKVRDPAMSPEEEAQVQENLSSILEPGPMVPEQ